LRNFDRLLQNHLQLTAFKTDIQIGLNMFKLLKILFVEQLELDTIFSVVVIDGDQPLMIDSVLK
jgi:hypothetical protein